MFRLSGRARTAKDRFGFDADDVDLLDFAVRFTSG
jgi:hypothetical protein